MSIVDMGLESSNAAATALPITATFNDPQFPVPAAPTAETGYSITADLRWVLMMVVAGPRLATHEATVLLSCYVVIILLGLDVVLLSLSFGGSSIAADSGFRGAPSKVENKAISLTDFARELGTLALIICLPADFLGPGESKVSK
jgi:hypothetical protein